VLLNLLTNAIKFTRDGAVTLAVECLERLPGKLRVRFTVTDSGPGIAKADQERIFAMFEQADNSLTRESGGSGLGLAISRRLAEAMEGSLTVQSESGAGSVFTFEVDFPLVAPSATGTGSLETLVSDLERRCRGWWALVADDDPVAQELARLLLEALGIRVEVAPDGAECLAMARRRAYDLVLMDWQMPQLDGIAATRQLRELPGYAETPVLAITAHAFEEDREACLAAGMCGYIAKPLDAKGLYRQLHDCLSRAG
jgi:CheY-like chemotaxis protein/anti-sigma regulatory factor (Ser/Thr protein kinase)